MSRITAKGQVTVPKPLRDRFGLELGTEVRLEEVDGRIVLRKVAAEALLDAWVGSLHLDDDVDAWVAAARDGE